MCHDVLLQEHLLALAKLGWTYEQYEIGVRNAKRALTRRKNEADLLADTQSSSTAPNKGGKVVLKSRNSVRNNSSNSNRTVLSKHPSTTLAQRPTATTTLSSRPSMRVHSTRTSNSNSTSKQTQSSSEPHPSVRVATQTRAPSSGTQAGTGTTPSATTSSSAITTPTTATATTARTHAAPLEPVPASS